MKQTFSITSDMFATEPTAANRQVVLETAARLSDGDRVAVGWGEVLEDLQRLGAEVPFGELIGALKGL